jgi:hypothetical protein
MESRQPITVRILCISGWQPITVRILCISSCKTHCGIGLTLLVIEDNLSYLWQSKSQKSIKIIDPWESQLLLFVLWTCDSKTCCFSCYAKRVNVLDKHISFLLWTTWHRIMKKAIFFLSFLLKYFRHSLFRLFSSEIQFCTSSWILDNTVCGVNESYEPIPVFAWFSSKNNDLLEIKKRTEKKKERYRWKPMEYKCVFMYSYPVFVSYTCICQIFNNDTLKLFFICKMAFQSATDKNKITALQKVVL